MKKIIHLLVVAALLISCDGGKKQTVTTEEYQPLAPSLCEDSAYAYVAAQCSFGPRTMNSEAHEACRQYLVEKFKSFGAKVYEQEADLNLYDGTAVKACNIVASFDTANDVRIIISSHWDSRPWADHDPDEANHKTPVDGANDGASGVALMLEMARQIQMRAPSVGIDFICWDAEDCGTPSWETKGDESGSTWCLGSQYWAGKHHIEGYRARYGILLDMVGGYNSVFRKEYFSMQNAPAIVDKVWSTGMRLGYSNYFSNEDGNATTDDHLQVNSSGIPCIDIIASNPDGSSFCDTWHTKNDNVNNISRETLKAVGQTVLEVIYNEK